MARAARPSEEGIREGKRSLKAKSGTKKNKRKPVAGEVIAILRRIVAENGRDYAGTYALTVLCLVAVSASTGFSAWIMRDVVDKVFYRQRYDLIALICGAVAVAFAIRGLAGYWQAVLLAKIGNNLVARYQKRLFDHLMRLGLDYFAGERSGHLAARINQNVTGVRDLLGLTLTSVARDAMSVIGLVGVMIVQDPLLSLIALLIGPPLIFTVNYLTRRLRSVAREAVEYNSRLIGAMQEATQGIAIVKAFTMEEQLSHRIAGLIAKAEQRANKIARVSELMAPISEVLAGLAIAGVIAYAGYRAAIDQQPPGAIFSFMTALLLAYDPARRLAKVQVGLEKSLVNARMIYEILDIEPQQRDIPGASELDVSRAAIRFRDVSFSYEEGQPVLHDVNFTAEAGRTTALVGSSGAGKSTLGALLQRFYDPDAGAIEIDGQDIAKVTKRSLRRSIAYVSQQPYLFEGSIRDNIRYGRPEATDAEVEAAAKLAHADEFIRLQRDGYDTPVGENGATLSGGQRQRLSIARAVITRPRLIVADEPVSALDVSIRAQILDLFADLNQRLGIAYLFITHDLTVARAITDQVMVMHEGMIVEEGATGRVLDHPESEAARELVAAAPDLQRAIARRLEMQG